MASAQMADADMLEHAKRLDGKVSTRSPAQAGWVQAIKQAPYFVHAHLSDRRRS